VPFLTISGSDFVEMFLGVGASRVRGHVRTGKEKRTVYRIHRRNRCRGPSWCGYGRWQRRARTGHLNQCWVEMDGFEANEGVCSSRDQPQRRAGPALLRPAALTVRSRGQPDHQGREKILGCTLVKPRLAPMWICASIRTRHGGFSRMSLTSASRQARAPIHCVSAILYVMYS